MPKRATPLTTVQVRSAKTGRYGMGGGLYLLVRDTGAAYWLFRYHDKAKRMREMGLGPARGDNAVRIVDARDKAAALRLEVRGGASPADVGAASRVPAGQVTFSMAAAEMIAAREAGWRNPKHKQQWRNTLATHAEPVFGAKPVAEVTTEDVLAALRPIWTTLPETASRLRGRIERVLAFAACRWRCLGQVRDRPLQRRVGRFDMSRATDPDMPVPARAIVPQRVAAYATPMLRPILSCPA